MVRHPTSPVPFLVNKMDNLDMGKSAKQMALEQLHSNPNAYYYRHNDPGESKRTGVWSEVCCNLIVTCGVMRTNLT